MGGKATRLSVKTIGYFHRKLPLEGQWGGQEGIYESCRWERRVLGCHTGEGQALRDEVSWLFSPE